jgi:hypothetical protein
MAKKSTNKAANFQNPELLAELMYHYTFSQDDMDRRKLRKNGWDDIQKAYFGYLPANWPYLAKVTDPVIRTAILEKTARLFAGKLRGTVVPREGADEISAKVMNALLDFQWDAATLGGTMLEKIIMMDIQTRLFGASFGLCYWDIKKDKNGETFETNEFKVLDNRDVFVDYQANHVRSSNWVQIREWVTFQDLKQKNDGGEPIYKNLDVLESRLLDDNKPAPERRDNKYTSIVKQLRSLEDRVGQDIYYPTIEIVTEYRRDRWITFAPRLGVILRDIENPYKTKEIPVVMLRYYPVGDDVYGESEVESVLPLYRALNSILCGFLDQINLAMRPPIKVANNAEGVRLDTLVYGPNAIWLTGNTTANVIEHQSGSQSIGSFQTSYTAMKSAIQTALGEQSLGLPPIGPFAQDKTATEIRTTQRQALARDNYNQIYLEEFLKDMVMKWISNNQQFLFADPTKEAQIVRIVGKEILQGLEDLGIANEEIPMDVMNEAVNLIDESGGNLTPEELQVIADTSKTPNFPVNVNGQTMPKLQMDERGMFANLYITQEDMNGLFDYIPDVKSMAIGVSDEAIRGRNQALTLLLNPAIEAKIAEAGQKVNVVELVKQILYDNGVKNADKLFEDKQNEQQLPTGLPFPTGQGPIPTSPSPIGLETNSGMANPPILPNQPTEVPQSL